LDRASTGLLLLTNDGKWSSKLTDPEHKVPKTYLVETAKDIAADTQHIFSQGIYFAYEDLTTRPAELTILSARQCRLTIHEGRYHQIKRMFHAVGNKVTSLHRESIGHIALDPNLHPGESRNLTAEEIMPFEPLNRGASAAAGENATSLDATQDT
ncbi:MAG: pseudouridine synthase, partial [Akkermansiaceae bacterium]